MDYEIVWTENASENLDKIISYLQENWTDKEIKKFITKLNDFLILLQKFPKILKKTSRYKNIFRGPINKYTIITYKINPKEKIIEILYLRSCKENLKPI